MCIDTAGSYDQDTSSGSTAEPTSEVDSFKTMNEMGGLSVDSSDENPHHSECERFGSSPQLSVDSENISEMDLFHNDDDEDSPDCEKIFLLENRLAEMEDLVNQDSKKIASLQSAMQSVLHPRSPPRSPTPKRPGRPGKKDLARINSLNFHDLSSTAESSRSRFGGTFNDSGTMGAIDESNDDELTESDFQDSVSLLNFIEQKMSTVKTNHLEEFHDESWTHRGKYPKSISESKQRSTRWENNRLLEDMTQESRRRLKVHRDKFDFAKDVFSFLMIAEYECSKEFIPAAIAWFIFCFQIMTYSLILLNISDINNPSNIFGLPPDVYISTRIAEIVAILITVATQEDLRTGLTMWFDRFKDSKFVTKSGNVTLLNWRCSVFARTLEGFLGPIVTFLLIMRSEDVVDLLLNFSAMEFISMLDDTAYKFCSQGFLGSVAKRVADEVDESFYYPKQKPTLRRNSTFGERIKRKMNLRSTWRAITFCLVVLAPLLVSWFVIFVKQQSGDFSCKIVYVQFDDSIQQQLGFFSGRYKFQHNGRRVLYKLDTTENPVNAQFAYCFKEKAWTFKDGDTNDPDFDPCVGYLLRSTRGAIANPFNILSVASRLWYVKTEEGRDIVVNGLRLFCSDCSVKIRGTKTGMCGANGHCNEDTLKCECKGGWYGSNCGFREPCGVVATDTVFDPFIGIREWSHEYTRLGLSNNTTNNNLSYVDLYNRPVYFSESAPSQFDLIMFTGRRWVVTTSNSFADINETITKASLFRYLQDDFHPLRSAFKISFISEPVQTDTVSDLTPSPVQLGWFNTENEDNIVSVDAVLLCAACHNDTNPCQSDGICNDDNRCDCSTNHATGALCHILPVGNGYCDSFFNTAIFEYDGGDCCHATCVGDDKYKCGHDIDNKVYHGYCDCVDPTQNLCPNGEGICWLQNSEAIVGDDKFAESGGALAFSANARVLAVGEPGMDRVKVYENVGHKWVQIGETLVGDPHSRFGETVSISGDGMILAVGASMSRPGSMHEGRVHVFDLHRTWHEVDKTPLDKYIHHKITNGRLGERIGLTQDGRIIYVDVLQRNGERTLLIFERNETTSEYFQSDPTIVFTVNNSDNGDLFNYLSDDLGRSLSISNSGNIVAIGGTMQGNKYFVRAHQYVFDEDSTSTLRPIGSKVLGCCGKISGDGNILVVSLAEGHDACQIYRWNKERNDWNQLGQTLEGTALAISSDGLTIAVEKPDEESGFYGIYAFFWDGHNWKNEGLITRADDATIAFSSGAMSGFDTVIAVGLPFGDSDVAVEGGALIYELQNNILDSPEECRKRHSHVRIEITLDSSPTETIWELRDPFTRNVILSDGPFKKGDRYTTKFYDTYLTNYTPCAEFSIYDMAGNGVCCSKGLGSFSLYLGDELIASGGNFDWTERLRFGNCELRCNNGESLFSLALMNNKYPHEIKWSLKDEDNDKLYMKGSFDLSTSSSDFHDEICLPTNMCANFTINKSISDHYSVSWKGNKIARGSKHAEFDSFFVGDNCLRTNKTFESITDNPQQIPMNVTPLLINSNTWDRTEFLLNDTSNLLETISTESKQCSDGYMNLVVNVTTDLYPSEIRWYLYSFPTYNNVGDFTEGSTILKGGPYTEGNKSFAKQICIDKCTLFYIFDNGSYGFSPEGYSLRLDGKIIGSGSKFDSEYYLIGDCYHLTSSITMNPGSQITCADDLRNNCAAPAECAHNGIVAHPSGKDEGKFTLRDGAWEIYGSYSMSFEKTCRAQCSGIFALSSVLNCADNENNIHLQLTKITDLVKTKFLLTTLDGKVLIDGNVDDSTGWTSMEHMCFEKDTCAILTLRMFTGLLDFVLFVEGEEIASDAATKDTTIYLGNCPGTKSPKQEGEKIPTECNDNETNFRLELQTGIAPREIQWSIKNDNGSDMNNGGPYSDALVTVSEEFCVVRNGCNTFTLHDSSRSGVWADTLYPVSYEVFVEGIKIASSIDDTGDMTRSAVSTVSFGSCN